MPLEAPANVRILRGAGVGLTWAKQDDFLLRATLAWRLSGEGVGALTFCEPGEKSAASGVLTCP